MTVSTQFIESLRGDAPYQMVKTFVSPTTRLVTNYKDTGVDGCNRFVLCFHGLNASLGQFDEIHRILNQEGFRVISFDFYGHGLSSDLPKRCRAIDKLYVSQAAELIEEIRSKLIEKPGIRRSSVLIPTDTGVLSATPAEAGGLTLSLIGFSMGGLIATSFYATNSDKYAFERVMLISPAGSISRVPKRLRLLQYKGMDKIAQSLAMGVHSVCSVLCSANNVKACYEQGIPSDPQSIRLFKDSWKCTSRRNLRSLLLVVSRVDLWNNESKFMKLADACKAGKISVSFHWGSADDITPVSESVWNLFTRDKNYTRKAPDVPSPSKAPQSTSAQGTAATAETASSIFAHRTEVATPSDAIRTPCAMENFRWNVHPGCGHLLFIDAHANLYRDVMIFFQLGAQKTVRDMSTPWFSYLAKHTPVMAHRPIHMPSSSEGWPDDTVSMTSSGLYSPAAPSIVNFLFKSAARQHGTPSHSLQDGLARRHSICRRPVPATPPLMGALSIYSEEPTQASMTKGDNSVVDTPSTHAESDASMLPEEVSVSALVLTS